MLVIVVISSTHALNKKTAKINKAKGKSSTTAKFVCGNRFNPLSGSQIIEIEFLMIGVRETN